MDNSTTIQQLKLEAVAVPAPPHEEQVHGG
jgi:hypothetical protein